MITLAQLETEYSADVLLNVASNLKTDLKEGYEPDSAELAAIRAEAQTITAASKPERNGKPEAKKSKPEPSPNPSTPTRREEVREEAKGALTKANQDLAKAAIASSTQQFEKVADLATGAGVTAFATRTAENTALVANELRLAGSRSEEIIEATVEEIAGLGGGKTETPLALKPSRSFGFL